MYYKEEWINGILYWKSHPNGEWKAFTMQQYKDKCLKLETELKRPLRDRIFELANELADDGYINEAVRMHQIRNDML